MALGVPSLAWLGSLLPALGSDSSACAHQLPLDKPSVFLMVQAKPGAAGIFLSPYGIAQALAMVLNGVEPGGESDEQLRVGGRVAGRRCCVCCCWPTMRRLGWHTCLA